MTFEIANKTPDINNALFQVTHGLYILTVKGKARLNGQCLDSLMQVTNMPPKIAIGVNMRSLTHEMIKDTKKFLVNVIDINDPDWLKTVRHFGFQSGHNVDKFADYDYTENEKGPIINTAKAFYECNLLPEKTLDLGTHSVFVGDVVKAGVREAGEPLTYNEYRRQVKEGLLTKDK